MGIDAEDTGGAERTEVIVVYGDTESDCRARDSGSASEIHDDARIEVGTYLLNDVLNEEEMQRPVIESERGPFAGTVERFMLCQRRLAAFDVCRRQRPQRPRDVAEAEVRKMAFLERCQIVLKSGNCQLRLPTALSTANWHTVNFQVWELWGG